MKEYKFGDVTVVAVSEKFGKKSKPCVGCFFFVNGMATCSDYYTRNKESAYSICLDNDEENMGTMLNKFKKV